ncbi:hypothetical protein HPB52_010740 [Rhipicephalus sanguineus]|uniref:Uncharacterized protein n=1 Tax=Rhipicephalus sanguineus TaxID=34632 RepID=A0A9D4PR97_RHISA|nr:hypothetical protein HPB52_010740 [Rhipicephalus sanguineus]
MGLTGSALQEWVDAERVIERDLRVQVRNEQRERIELEERRLQAEERVLQLKLKLQEQATSSNAGERCLQRRFLSRGHDRRCSDTWLRHRVTCCRGRAKVRRKQPTASIFSDPPPHRKDRRPQL